MGTPRNLRVRVWVAPFVVAIALGAAGPSAIAAGGWDAEVLLAQAPKETPTEPENGVGDPLEPLNRVIFKFNELFRGFILGPATEIYSIFIPPPVRTAIGNVLANLRTPIVLANDVLQGRPGAAWQTTQRFAINSTLGIGGIVDRAAKMGIEAHDEDFGQTMGVWGVGEGFYLVLPLFGPSNPRDAVGKHVVDGYFDPLDMWLDNTNRDAAVWARTSVGGVDTYSGVVDELDQIRKTSIDFYAALRSMYRQKRAAEIRNGAGEDLPPIPDIDYELD
ncbi:MAG: VacJ family lipoprotein [Rhodospirillales bacterium]|nr:VacJ family lipoprotein [Rhodospirillales bacterium]